MIVETVAIETLSGDPANARKHDQRNLDAIKASLRRFGQQKPIVVDSGGIVRAGNGTLAAAKLLGWTHINVVRSELGATELTAYAIVDNRTAELAAWDADVLTSLVASGELGDVGFTEDELKKFVDKSKADGDGGIEDIHASFEVVVECRDETEQKQVYERLTGEGYSCRLFTL